MSSWSDYDCKSKTSETNQTELRHTIMTRLYMIGCALITKSLNRRSTMQHESPPDISRENVTSIVDLLLVTSYSTQIYIYYICIYIEELDKCHPKRKPVSNVNSKFGNHALEESSSYICRYICISTYMKRVFFPKDNQRI